MKIKLLVLLVVMHFQCAAAKWEVCNTDLDVSISPSGAINSRLFPVEILPTHQKDNTYIYETALGPISLYINGSIGFIKIPSAELEIMLIKNVDEARRAPLLKVGSNLSFVLKEQPLLQLWHDLKTLDNAAYQYKLMYGHWPKYTEMIVSGGILANFYSPFQDRLSELSFDPKHSPWVIQINPGFNVTYQQRSN